MAQSGWMHVQRGMPNCPPGLEYLTSLDQLQVNQEVSLAKATIGYETNLKFAVFNKLGQQVYFLIEDSGLCARNFCGTMRPFDMFALDSNQNEVIHFYRPFTCNSCCFPCWLGKMEVYAPPGNLVGFIEQKWTLCAPFFHIYNANGEIVLFIKGPACAFDCGKEIEFVVLSADGETKVGKVSKQWSNVVQELFTDATNFGISFPMNLDVRLKAVMLGACVLIDFMYFTIDTT